MNLTQKAWQNVTRLDHPEGFTLGPINAETWLRDPKHMGFMIARYKFAAKMMRRCTSILEVGCGEGLGTMLMLKDTSANLFSTDFDEAQIRYANEHVAPHCGQRATFQQMDLVSDNPGSKMFDGLLSIDVIEHIHPQDEKAFLDHCVGALKPGGMAIIGTPNLHADVYASPPSRAGHVNLFDPERFSETLERYFSHVFLFSMNDEMVHTGFSKMAHYLMALCVKAGA